MVEVCTFQKYNNHFYGEVGDTGRGELKELHVVIFYFIILLTEDFKHY